MKHNTRQLLSVYMALLLLLTACGSNEATDTCPSGGSETQNTPEASFVWSVNTETLYSDNSSTRFGVQTADNGNGVYYMRGQTAAYYDCELNAAAVLCVQQGCQHKDSSCVAWQGETLSFGVYDGMWYALVPYDNGGLAVRKTVPDTNERTVIFELGSPGEDSFYTVGNLYFSHGCAYFSVISNTLTESGHMYEISGAWLVRIPLHDGEAKKISIGGAREIIFVGGSENQFAVFCRFLDESGEPLLTESEFYEQNPNAQENYDGEAYVAYYSEYVSSLDRRNMELRLYDVQTGEYEILTQGIELIASDLGHMCYGDIMVYCFLDRDTGDSELWLYDFVTGKNICLVEGKWIVEYNLLDDKIFYNVSLANDGGGYSFYYADIYKGKNVKIENEGASDYKRYGAVAETREYFIAANGGPAMQSLLKTNYYADDYSSASTFN